MERKDLSIVERGGIGYVTERLREFGAEVREMSRTNKGYDLSVTLPDGRHVRVEVKTTDDSQAKPKWLIQRHYRHNFDPNHYFVFVALDSGQLRATYVLPSATVSMHLDEMNTAYDQRNPSAKPNRPYKVVAHDSFLSQYHFGWLEPFEDNWDVIFAVSGRNQG